MAALAYPWIDPVLVDLPGPFAVRWYGMMYVVGFICAFFVLRFLSRREQFPVPEKKISDLLMAMALGVFIGGRLGYVLFYQVSELSHDPLMILRVWEGGMSFHGGMIGVILVTWLIARNYGTTFLRLADGFALSIPFGIFFVRVANFINGELYGRVTDASSPFAMKFPKDPVAQRLLGIEGRGVQESEVVIAKAMESGLWDEIQHLVPYRHPSQLYEAVGEGVLVGLIAWGVYWWINRKGIWPTPGLFGGIFLTGYGLFRSLIELYRQPDVQFTSATDPIGYVLGSLTMGQVLSLLMIPFGLFFIIRSLRNTQWNTQSH